MSKNSLNIVDAIKAHLPDDFINRLSSALGDSTETTRAGVDAGIPSLLLGLDSAASTADGARRVAAAVNDADDNILNNLGSIFGRSTFSDLGLGSLRSIMGGGALSELARGLGRTTGLSSKGVTTLLGFLVPVVLGGLKRIMRTQGLGASDILNMLSSQRSNIEAAIPREMTAPGRTYTDERRRDVAEDTYTAPRARETRTESSSLAWLLPLALVALAAGLIWHFSSPRRTVQAGNEAQSAKSQTRGSSEQYQPRPANKLTALRMKYQSVFEVAQSQGVKISEVRERDGKLVIKGSAPSSEAASKVWDEIKRVNPEMNEVIANFPVASMTAPTAVLPDLPRTEPEKLKGKMVEPDTSTERAAVSESDGQAYTVKPGDTLTSISKHFYGSGNKYTRILDANQNKISDKDRIQVGQELTIPKD